MDIDSAVKLTKHRSSYIFDEGNSHLEIKSMSDYLKKGSPDVFSSPNRTSHKLKKIESPDGDIQQKAKPGFDTSQD